MPAIIWVKNMYVDMHKCKTANKCLNAFVQKDMVNRNKDDPLLSSAALWIANVCQRKIQIEKKKQATMKLLHPTSIYVWSYGPVR